VSGFRLGVLLAVVHQIGFTVETAAIHAFGASLTVAQMALLRCLGGISIALAWAATGGGITALRSRHPKLQVVRGLTTAGYGFALMWGRRRSHSTPGPPVRCALLPSLAYKATDAEAEANIKSIVRARPSRHGGRRSPNGSGTLLRRIDRGVGGGLITSHGAVAAKTVAMVAGRSKSSVGRSN